MNATGVIMVRVVGENKDERCCSCTMKNRFNRVVTYRNSTSTWFWSIPGGIVPVKALSKRNKTCRVAICPSSEGTAPDNLFWGRIRISSADKLPSCVGNVPVKALEESLNSCSVDNNPISVGRLPISPFSTTSTVTTWRVRLSLFLVTQHSETSSSTNWETYTMKAQWLNLRRCIRRHLWRSRHSRNKYPTRDSGKGIDLTNLLRRSWNKEEQG